MTKIDIKNKTVNGNLDTNESTKSISTLKEHEPIKIQHPRYSQTEIRSKIKSLNDMKTSLEQSNKLVQLINHRDRAHLRRPVTNLFCGVDNVQNKNAMSVKFFEKIKTGFLKKIIQSVSIRFTNFIGFSLKEDKV